MGRFYKELDYPRIPEEILSDETVGKVLHNVNTGTIGLNERCVNGKVLKTTEYCIASSGSQDLKDWISSNVVLPIIPKIWKNYVNANLYYRTTNGSFGDTFIVHSDYNSVASLMYFLDTGGDNVVTSWYQETGYPLNRIKIREVAVRDRDKHPEFSKRYQQADTGIVCYDNIKVIESFVAKPHTWYLYCGAVLHDVQNITTTRKYYTIAFTHFEKLKLFGFPDFDLTSPVD